MNTEKENRFPEQPEEDIFEEESEEDMFMNVEEENTHISGFNEMADLNETLEN